MWAQRLGKAWSYETEEEPGQLTRGQNPRQHWSAYVLTNPLQAQNSLRTGLHFFHSLHWVMSCKIPPFRAVP